MTSYVEHLNATIRDVAAATEGLVVYGQNVAAGSCLSGLTRNLAVGPGGRVLNTPNVENTLVGVGFGLMLRGVPALFCVKQQDFVLLGLDHIVNTYNIVRRLAPSGSFTILAIMVDHGFEGPQSCLNNLADFCSMANVPGYAMTNRHDSETILHRHLVAPGFRILGVSQRLFNTPLLSFDGPVDSFGDGGIFRYAMGDDATIVAFNLALPQAEELRCAAAATGAGVSLFSVNAGWRMDWEPLLRSVEQTGRLVILDDSKSAHRPSDGFLAVLGERGRPERLAVVRREFSPDWLRPNPDRLEIDCAAILARIGLN